MKIHINKWIAHIANQDSKKYIDLFSTDHLTENIKQHAVKGGVKTFGGQAIKFLLNLASTIILARLLTPTDFGLIAMVIAITGFVALFKDLGVSISIVQKQKINSSEVSTLFWLVLVICFVLTIFTASISPFIAWFYNDNRLVNVTIVLSLTFLITGLSTQHFAIMTRQMRFGALIIIDVAALICGVVVAIVCAIKGMGYWSLVNMQLAISLVTTLFAWLFCHWRPGLPSFDGEVRKTLAFGGYLTAFSVVNYAARNFDNIIIGERLGANVLGLYSRAYSLLLLPIGQIVSPVTSVATPTLSRIQNEPERYEQFYLKAVTIIAYLSMPLIVMMGVLSEEIILVVYGPNWEQAADIFKILSLAAFWQPVVSTVGWIYISLANTRRMFLWAVIAVPLHVLSFIIGVQWGAQGVATCYAIVFWLLVIPSFSFAFTKSPISLTKFISCIARPFLLSIVILASTLLIKDLITCDESIYVLIITVAGGGLIGFITILMFKPLRNDCKYIFQIKQLIRA